MIDAERVLELLYDRGEGFFAMEELSSSAGVDRQRLYRALDELGTRGHEFEFMPSLGIRLVRPANPDAHLVRRGLGTRRIGRSVLCFREVDSTNDVAFDSADKGQADGLVVLSHYQRKGRGRQGRAWLSRPRTNVLMSVLLIDPEHSPLCHEAVTVGAGLAVAEGIDSACGLACRLKWPNDVLIDGAKVAGMLVELRRRDDRRCVVIGVGINANAAPPPDKVDKPATCLADCLAHPIERNELIRHVLRRMEHWIEQIEAGRIDELHAEWLGRCDMINERIAARAGERQYVGRVLDVSPMEGLILACDDGRSVHLPAETTTIV